MVAPTTRLANGVEIPTLGLGTSPMDDAETERAVAHAIETGYRLIDTAENYRNEAGVGRGIRAAGVPREEIFVTTKFNARWHSVEGVAEAFAASASRLGTDYIDLMLIHWPNPQQDRYVQAWQGLLALLEAGKVRAIGTSNFKPAHLRRLLDETGVLPHVNQIQLSPLWTREETREFHAGHDICTEGYSPIGAGNELLDTPIIGQIGQGYGKTPAQVVLRWHVQLGVIPIPKSANPRRIEQNLDVFDFTLTAEEVAALSALDLGEGAATDSDTTGH